MISSEPIIGATSADREEIIDNTSIYLRFEKSVTPPEDGTIASVEGKWSKISFGSDNPLAQSIRPSCAYAIDVRKVEPLRKMRFHVITQSKPQSR